MAKARRKTTARKSTARKAKVQTTSGGQEVQRVEAGGIDPRLAEERERRRQAESDVRFAHHSEPAQLDPKLAEIREKTIEEEKKLADRPLTKPPARTTRQR